jgi:hypothetical protein
MRAERVEALRDAAAGGVDCDGLRVERTDAGYVFETPARRREGLDAEAFERVARDHADYVSNWAFWARDRPDAERAFLRWVEAAEERGVPERYDALGDGVSRSWGEVLVTARLDDDGQRRYALRHEDDAGVDGAELEAHDGLADARELVERDDCGRYRPLKTAPTLRDGWLFADLDGRDCVRTVETVYPATVANWHREREGDFDVDHWTEAIARHTGIYGVVQTWNRGEGHEHVNRVAEACCADSQCLKRREWEYDEDTDLDVDGGDGVFPCREPCSMVVSAARKWTRLEGETERTYEFTLTPSEREQIAEVVDAVADGRVDEIREADFGEGANRWRARYLRAKRFDDDGDRSGPPE